MSDMLNQLHGSSSEAARSPDAERLHVPAPGPAGTSAPVLPRHRRERAAPSVPPNAPASKGRYSSNAVYQTVRIFCYGALPSW